MVQNVSPTFANVISNGPFRIVSLVASLLLLFGLIWLTSRDGFASWQIAKAARAISVPAADKALRFSPANADAHLIRGQLLEANGDLVSAIAEYKTAASLRPRDYVLWLMLARALELSGERQEAINAARLAIPLAPAYAQPHWQLGNMLLRAGQSDEAFAELKLAAASDSAFQQSVMDLAWQFSDGSVAFVKQIVPPANPAANLALAEFFAAREQNEEATAMFANAGNDPTAVAARKRIITELIATKRFAAAEKLWLIGRAANTGGDSGAVVNGSFEEETNLDEPGFNWRRENPATTIVQSLDVQNPRQGKVSLLIDFNGNSDPAAAIISELVLVSPAAHYRLQFAARADALTSGGLPVVTITDAATGDLIGQSDLSQAGAAWRDFTVDLTTGQSTSAIRIALQRRPCSAGPCPIFGRLWLDAFALTKR
jgi:hypothetical protein